MAKSFDGYLVLLLFGIFLMPALLAGAQTRPVTVDQMAEAGKFEGLLYTNKWLGVKMLAPGGWSFVSKERNAELVAANRERAARSGDAVTREYADNTQILFQAVPPAFAGQENSALFSAGIQRLIRRTSIDGYMAANRDLVLQTPGSRLLRDIHAVSLGSSRFKEFEVEMPKEGGTYRQRYLATLRSDIALFFVITIHDDRQLNMIDLSLNSLKLAR